MWSGPYGGSYNQFHLKKFPDGDINQQNFSNAIPDHNFGHGHHLDSGLKVLTHWGRMTHICIGNLTIIGSDHGLAPGRRQAIIWTNALFIGPLRTNFSEI